MSMTQADASQPPAATMQVLSPGILSSVQDGGRPGLLSKGVAPAGAQDAYALALANLLVGNEISSPVMTPGPRGAAGLEFTLIGPKLVFNRDVLIAITGAPTKATLAGRPIPHETSVVVRAGELLDVGKATVGTRGYLAVSGGLDVPLYFGSRSTHLSLGFGGHEGRALARGDFILLAAPDSFDEGLGGMTLADGVSPTVDGSAVLRVVPGPQVELFREASVDEFYSSTWQMTPVANRMGFRVKGPQLEFKPRAAEVIRDAGRDDSNIVDDVTPMGGIQVPGNAEAIIMGVEVPSVGGYAKIGTVISSDMGRLGQVRPGGNVRFEAVDLAKALLIAERERSFLVPASLVRARARTSSTGER
jgi:biotin-dependent carboxylase-like uncharacterized protein